jgi:hypothetical protein
LVSLGLLELLGVRLADGLTDGLTLDELLGTFGPPLLYPELLAEVELGAVLVVAGEGVWDDSTACVFDGDEYADFVNRRGSKAPARAETLDGFAISSCTPQY